MRRQVCDRIKKSMVLKTSDVSAPSRRMARILVKVDMQDPLEAVILIFHCCQIVSVLNMPNGETLSSPTFENFTNQFFVVLLIGITAFLAASPSHVAVANVNKHAGLRFSLSKAQSATDVHALNRCKLQWRRQLGFSHGRSQH